VSGPHTRSNGSGGASHRRPDSGARLRSLDGTWIRIPNARVLKDPIETLTTEAVRRSRLTVGVAYDTNLADATDVIAAALERVARICDDPRRSPPATT